LTNNSPAVNNGNNCVITANGCTDNNPAIPNDQRGAARVGAVDIGAFELNNTSTGGNFVATLPDGKTGIAYNYVLVLDKGAFTYSLTGGELPNGISVSTSGAVVSVSGTTAVSGEFNFSVTATDGTNSAVTDYTIRFTQTTVSLSGSVTYAIKPSGETAKAVANVLFNATGTSNSSAMSDGAGKYSLSGLIWNGNYTVTPSKDGNINGISPFDATMILRHIAANGSGPNALDANQRIAADTSGDGNITPFDATLILRYLASGGANANTGQIGNWKFDPVSRPYQPLNSSMFDQNYTAILVGEVNGDWNP
jgi:hypothetical protein